MPAKNRRKAKRRAVTMDDGAKNWLIKTAVANLWRVPSWYRLDDLIEEGVICYYVVRDKYPYAFERSHIMALFKTTFYNHLKILANERTHGLEQRDVEELEVLNARCPDGDMLDYIAKAPAMIAKVFLAVLNRAEELDAPLAQYENGRRETTNERLCKLVGINPSDCDLAESVSNYLHAV